MSIRRSQSFLVLVATLLPGCALIAQTAPKQPPPPGKLHAVKVEGNRVYSAADIQRALGLRVGGRVNPADFEMAKDKLLRTDLFTGVSYSFRFAGKPPLYDLTITVNEYETLLPVRFERLEVSDDQIRAYLQQHVTFYQERIPGTQAVLKRYSEAIEEFVKQSQPDRKIRGQVSSDDPNQLSVVFMPDAPAPVIARVEVTGNKAIENAPLLRAINDTAIGQPYSDVRMKAILDNTIRPLYAAKGFTNISFPKVEASPAKGVNGYLVKIQVQEGPAFKFGSIGFRGSVLDQDQVKTLMTFKPGVAFNSDQVETLKKELIAATRRRGYLQVSGTVDQINDDSKHVVNVRYNITPGPQYTFNNLEVAGLDITTEPVVRKMWGVKPGKPFNPEYPEFFLKKIKESGMFDNLSDTKSEFKPNDQSHTVDVKLSFKGGKAKPLAPGERSALSM